MAVESKSSARNILILGTAAAGKYTLVKHVLDEDQLQEKIEQGSDQQSWIRRQAEIKIHCGKVKDVPCSFILVDTASPESHDTPQVIHANLMSKMKTMTPLEDLNLIILLIRQGCCTPSDLGKLLTIVEDFFSTECKPITVLIHSGCDGFNEEAKRNYIETFAKSGSEITRKLAEYPTTKSALCIGFPNINDNSNPVLVKCYKASIKQSEEELRKLIIDSHDPIPTKTLFANPSSDGNWRYYCVCL